jgi:LemA protein
MGATSMKDHAKSENMLTGALKSLFAVAENYPDLKANQNFLHLQEELTDTEDKLQAARRFYNNAVKSMNTAVESVPTNIIANMFKFKKREFFELEEGEKEAASKPVETKFE